MAMHGPAKMRVLHHVSAAARQRGLTVLLVVLVLQHRQLLLILVLKYVVRLLDVLHGKHAAPLRDSQLLHGVVVEAILTQLVLLFNGGWGWRGWLLPLGGSTDCEALRL
jgi:hypothetical protein